MSNHRALITGASAGIGRELARVKRSAPGFIWYDVDVVVREGLAALEKGRAVFISGRLYRFLIPILRMPISRWLISAFGVKL